MYTGNTYAGGSYKNRYTVYPCVYREHSYKFFILFPNGGLSRCVQGTLEHTCIILVSTRFIPVHTGNTYPIVIVAFGDTVYPCAYREHELNLLRLVMQRGLSLCIQGTQTPFLVEIMDVRFIPVHTGNTNELSSNSIPPTVYPCAYREHSNYNILFYN